MSVGSSIKLATAVLAVCAVAVAVEAKPQRVKRHHAQSQWVYFPSVSNFWASEDPVFDKSRVLREVWLVSNTVDRAGEAAFPAELTTGSGAFSVRVQLEFTVTADDRVTACVASNISKRFNSGPAHELSSPAIAAAACKLAQTRLTFRHGLLQDGAKLGQRLGMAIYFQRWSEAEPLLQNAMAPPPVFPQPAWPPMMPSEVVALDVPQWTPFLPPAGTMPGSISTGLRIDIDKSGAVTRCIVAQPSGNADFDTGVCSAFSASIQRGIMGRSAWAYPVRVRWDGKQMRLATISWPVAPELADPDELPQGLAPPAPLLGNTKVGLILFFDPAGKVARCMVLASAMHDDLDLFSCAAFGSKLTFKPGKDIFGDAVGGAMTFEVDWRARSFQRQDYN